MSFDRRNKDKNNSLNRGITRFRKTLFSNIAVFSFWYCLQTSDSFVFVVMSTLKKLLLVCKNINSQTSTVISYSEIPITT